MDYLIDRMCELDHEAKELDENTTNELDATNEI